MINKQELTKIVILFLQHFYDETSSKDVLAIINRLSNTHKNDQQQSISWDKYLNTAKEKLLTSNQLPLTSTHNDKIIPEEQAFEAMYALLIDIYKQTNSNDIGSFLGDLLHAYYGETSDPAAWYNWERFLQKVISERQTTDEISAN